MPTAFANGRAARPVEMRLRHLPRLQRCQMRETGVMRLRLHAMAANAGMRVLRPPARLPRANTSRGDAEVPAVAVRLRRSLARPRRRRTTRHQPVTELT